MPEIEDIIETTDSAPFLLWWQYALIGLALTLALGFILFFTLRYYKKRATKQPEINNLKSALLHLSQIKSETLDDTELATKLSILTRQYLQHQFKHQSLFQTHQEFSQDHQDLEKLPEATRSQVTNYLQAFSHHKYLPDSNLPTAQAKLIQHTETLLKATESTREKITA